MRKDPLISGEIYHLFTKSIAEYKIFNNNDEFSRMVEAIDYYKTEKPNIKLSKFIKRHTNLKNNIISDKKDLIEIIAYCIMPTHIHLVLKQIKENGISVYMSNILNSYTRYFNTKHNRKGPLWEGRFKNVLVETDEQLLHLTRYIHLNPVTACLIDNPEQWTASSYEEYLSIEENDKICNYEGILDIKPNTYKNFVHDRISYQRELAKIKSFLID